MLMINCKVELKLRWTNHCVLASTGVENDGVNSNNIIFTGIERRLYVPAITLRTKENQKLSKPLSKGFESSVYWSEYKTKRENKNWTNEYRYFLKSNIGKVKKLFVLVYSNIHNAKKYTAQHIIHQKVLSKFVMSLSMEKTFMTNPLILI